MMHVKLYITDWIKCTEQVICIFRSHTDNTKFNYSRLPLGSPWNTIAVMPTSRHVSTQLNSPPLSTEGFCGTLGVFPPSYSLDTCSAASLGSRVLARVFDRPNVKGKVDEQSRGKGGHRERGICALIHTLCKTTHRAKHIEQECLRGTAALQTPPSITHCSVTAYRVCLKPTPPHNRASECERMRQRNKDKIVWVMNQLASGVQDMVPRVTGSHDLSQPLCVSLVVRRVRGRRQGLKTCSDHLPNVKAAIQQCKIILWRSKSCIQHLTHVKIQ